MIQTQKLQREDLLSSVRAPALIYPNGTVEASHPAVYTIASWTYGKDKIRLHAHTEHSLEHYTDNEEWRLLKVSVIEDEYEHEGINERFTLGVTAILTMAVLSLVVSEKVPHSSTHVPLLVAYFLFNMISVSVAAMTTGLVMKVHRMGRHGQEPEEWLLRLFCLHPVKIRNGIYTVADSPFHTPSYIKELSGELRKCESQPMAERIPVLESYIKKLASTCANIQGEIDDIDVDDPTAFRRRREANGYVRISERLDIIFMSFFLSLVTIPVVVLFYLM
ncbi:Neurotransmitter-gated ion-channel transmembrane region [Necator americanus]|uniref:Neurotransmitter-gated ion-channel transmembrane region n=1 Tax=Necator americanus TaxID=51031 RepID=W2T2Q1_NECAM|nr:Neurotransmitter-gated ion-channel transmembrane region [Necator americanus]ETN75521.1 Neurotransmitter-gated ion-channel transmembrane region [Necator americanus]